MSDPSRHVFSLSDDGREAIFASVAQGPWSPEHCHGGAVGALVVHAAEALSAPAPMEVARLTLELHRPVPVGTVAVETTVVREGKRLQLLDTRLLDAGAEVARGSVLKLRTADLDLPPDLVQPTLDRSPPEAGIASEVPAGRGFGSLFNLSSVGGAFRPPGPAAIWFRLNGVFTPGRAASGVALAAAVADFSNGISSVVPFEQFSFINPDLTLNLARSPVGEWVLSDAETVLGPGGRAVARTRLADRTGWFGHATQSVLLERRR